MALLPLDDDSRTDARVGSAFQIRALADPGMRETYREGDRLIRAAVAERLAVARDDGALADVDADREATVLLALVGGLAEALLLGDHDEVSAVAVLDHQLGRLRR